MGVLGILVVDRPITWPSRIKVTLGGQPFDGCRVPSGVGRAGRIGVLTAPGGPVLPVHEGRHRAVQITFGEIHLAILGQVSSGQSSHAVL